MLQDGKEEEELDAAADEEFLLSGDVCGLDEEDVGGHAQRVEEAEEQSNEFAGSVRFFFGFIFVFSF